MNETTKYLLQAIGSIAGEVRELRNSFDAFNALQSKQLEYMRHSGDKLDDFKEKMNIRLMAMQEAWHRTLNEHLAAQSGYIDNRLKNFLKCVTPKLPIKKTIKKSVKRKKK